MSDLQAKDFGQFYRACYDRAPFPWQERLAAEVLDGGWPDVLSLPTGAGKTSVLDVALFALAVDPRRFSRRIVFVVDRRVVVDQAAEHAVQLLKALQNAKTGIARDVAARLRSCWHGPEGEVPFVTSVLRGGMPRDDAWARRPDQPVVAVSTVDQVGSRLLFRGYGVSEKMASVHAGLLGHDTLFLLDEVHLSVPFCETLLEVDRWRHAHRGANGGAGHTHPELPDRWAVVRLSATAALRKEDRVFKLDRSDRENEQLDRRLRASKIAKLIPVRVKGSDEANHRARVAEQAIAESLRLIEAGARASAVVVNRVDTARLVRRGLEEHRDRIDAVLLTGRMRPLDRDRVLNDALLDRIASGRARAADAKPLVVVATQCIEAGADFDFDGLVTECASLDALRQRFGRLDRLGELGRSQAVILCRADLADGKTIDPIYGSSLPKTWSWLTSHGEVANFGVDHLKLPDDEVLKTLVTPMQHAPLLLPPHLERWAQTSPVPEPDPDVSLWLHGPDRGQPEVQLVWRADVTVEGLQHALDNDRDDLVAIVSEIGRAHV